jgi:hypothetical protein
MKKLILTVSLSLISTVFLLAQSDYTMFETMYVRVKNDKVKEFEKGVSAHNKKYHNEAPYEAQLHYIAIGQHAGNYSWVMGPCTFTDLDTRPSGAHDEDWAMNVTPYVNRSYGFENWIMDDKLSYSPENEEAAKKLFVRHWDVKDGMEKKFKHILGGILAVFNEKKSDHSFRVYSSAFNTGNDRDMIGVMGFGNWAFFDEDNNFQKDYEALHGDGSWAFFESEIKTCLNSTTIEIREVIEPK